jgi:heat shock protein HslJ
MRGSAYAAVLVVLASVLFPVCILAESTLALIGPTWLLLEAKGMAVKVPADARQPFILFQGTEKRVSGYSGCNEFFGNYELKGDTLTFGPVGMTRRSCEGAAGDTESVFLKVLGETRSWKIEKGILVLLDNSGVLARFRMKANGTIGR